MTKLLQVPDGMKRKALKIADEMGDVIIDCESCYGACDIASMEAKALGCDSIVHYGHSKFMECGVPVKYMEEKVKYNPVSALRAGLKAIDEKRIGLVATVQFLDSLKEAKRFLEIMGRAPKIGKGHFADGQVLGCDTSAAMSIEKDVDAFLFIGSGHFHPLGLAMQTQKPVYLLNVERDEMEDMCKLRDKFLKQRYAAQALAKDARTFGILVTVKSGQMKVELAKKIKKGLEAKGKRAYILSFNEIKPDKLIGIDVDCYINTACPRIGIENRTEFRKPIVNADEIEV